MVEAMLTHSRLGDDGVREQPCKRAAGVGQFASQPLNLRHKCLDLGCRREDGRGGRPQPAGSGAC
jgi:hypothetical protein